jgi:hypothetical protein
MADVESPKPAKGKRTVHAESDTVEIISENGRWWVASKRRPELGVEEVTIEYAAWFFHRKPDTFVHHRGLPGGEEFDALV